MNRYRNLLISNFLLRGSITFFLLYHYETGMTQQLIWYMTQTNQSRSSVRTTQIQCGRYSNYRFSTSGPRISGLLRFFLFCGNGNLSTFRNDYRALLGTKIFVWSIRNFWHQAVLGNRSGRCPKCHFPTSSPRFLLTKMAKIWFFVVRPNLSILRKWRFLAK